MASRYHCTIERRQDKWVLKDHSTNGTFVTLDGDDAELVLQREELTLRKHGFIAFGQSRVATEEVVEFFVE
jgi:predicted component of type VI protein secretion system